MTTRTALDEHEELLELERASEAGEFDHVGRAGLEYLVSQLPDGYVRDGDNHVIRLDPTLPDELYIPALINGVQSDPVRVPVYK